MGFTEEANSMFFSLFFSFLFWDLYVCTFLLNLYNRFPRVHIWTFEAQEPWWKYKHHVYYSWLVLNDFFFFFFFARSFYTHVICYIYICLGGSELEEIELPHLDGHKGSHPVRIGNGAATHIQLVRVSFSGGFFFFFFWSRFLGLVITGWLVCASDFYLLGYLWWIVSFVFYVMGVGNLFIELFRMDCVYLGQKVCVIRFFFFFLKVSVYAYSNFKTTT